MLVHKGKFEVPTTALTKRMRELLLDLVVKKGAEYVSVMVAIGRVYESTHAFTHILKTANNPEVNMMVGIMTDNLMAVASTIHRKVEEKLGREISEDELMNDVNHINREAVKAQAEAMGHKVEDYEDFGSRLEAIRLRDMAPMPMTFGDDMAGHA